MKKIVPLFAVVLLSACATTTNFGANVASWNGRTEGALVQAWGPPSSVYPMQDGSKVLTYNRSGDTHTTVAFNQATSRSDSCTVNFTLNPGGTITNSRYEGNKCVAEDDWRVEAKKEEQRRRREEYGQGAD